MHLASVHLFPALEAISPPSKTVEEPSTSEAFAKVLVVESLTRLLRWWEALPGFSCASYLTDEKTAILHDLEAGQLIDSIGLVF